MATPLRSPDAALPRRGIDHVTFGTRDCAAAKRLYERALAPLGLGLAFDWPDGGRACFGLAGERSSLWLVESDDPGRASLTLAAGGREAVDAFYAAAVAAGAEPLARPSFRPEYTASTYAASVRDADGNTLEAMCRSAVPPASARRAA